jgi:hypothetical protein
VELVRRRVIVDGRTVAGINPPSVRQRVYFRKASHRHYSTTSCPRVRGATRETATEVLRASPATEHEMTASNGLLADRRTKLNVDGSRIDSRNRPVLRPQTRMPMWPQCTMQCNRNREGNSKVFCRN